MSMQFNATTPDAGQALPGAGSAVQAHTQALPVGRRALRILNLGAGVQSTCVFLMSREGLIQPFDYSIFADVHEEPEAVYKHLEWLKSLLTPPILVRTIGRLGDDLIAGRNSAGGQKRKAGLDGTKRFASIPAFTAPHHETREQLVGCQEGRTRRQCTRDYKTDVVKQAIRQDILGLKPKQRMPKGIHVEQFFGISVDEKNRAVKIRKRFEKIAWATPHFPLIEMGFRRGDCEDWLKDRVPHQTPRSACVFCPYRGPSEWLSLKQNDPVGFARAVEIDHALRTEGAVANRDMKQALYVHRKCIPLDMVDLEAEARKEAGRKGPNLFALYGCDEGMCGV